MAARFWSRAALASRSLLPKRTSAGAIAAGVSLVLALALLAAVLVYRARFERILIGVTEARLELVAADTAARIQDGVDLGLELEDMTGVQAILEEARGEPGIVAIEVLAQNGERLFASGDSRRSSSPPIADRIGPLPDDDDDEGVAGGPIHARFVTEDGLVGLSIGLADLFGQEIGKVVLIYTPTTVEATVRGLTLRLAATAIPLVLLAAFLLRLVTGSVLRGPEAALQRMRERLEALAAGSPLPPEDAITGDAASRELVAAETTLARALDELAKARCEAAGPIRNEA